MKLEYENRKQKFSCVKETIIMEMHLSIFNNELFCLHQTDKKFKSIFKNTKSKANLNKYTSSEKKFLRVKKIVIINE